MSIPSEQLVHTCNRDEIADLRLLHYNDVYHIEAGSREPVGGIARFQTLCKYYQEDNSFHEEPSAITLFSGDAFNPSLESSVTKGAHMVPVLNHTKVACACVGNHDLDFGVEQFERLASKCDFPWLLANVLDPALGNNVPLGHAKRTLMLTASNGIKIGVIGLVEREWLDTINSLPPIQYVSASKTAEELVPGLRAQGAQIIIALTHQREPNDIKLANNTSKGLIDIILGGHDHMYQHRIANDVHILRSGTDFKNLSHIRAWRKKDNANRWEFDIHRQDIIGSIAEDAQAAAIVDKISSGLREKLEKPVGYTATPLDARFTTVRRSESNIGNFVCDIMRLFYKADCTIVAAGTIRGDQVYPVGILRAKDIMNCFPFEDPIVALKLSGQAILDALENAVSTYPALEGRFPQVSNINFTFDASQPPGRRITTVTLGGAPLDLKRQYTCATRDYMARGKDGFTSLLSTSAGGTCEELVSDENGMLISTLLRQYFMSVQVVGQWKPFSESMNSQWKEVHIELHKVHPVNEPGNKAHDAIYKHEKREQRKREDGKPQSGDDSEDENVHEELRHPDDGDARHRELCIMRKFIRKWWRLTGNTSHLDVGHDENFSVGWTKVISPHLEGRIKIVGVGA